MTPSIHLRMPPSWFFKFPPDDQPLALPPPTDARTFASPFGIPTDIYNGALDYKVPITIATLYATTAVIWNRINKSRGYKPYAFSQTSAFKAFVIVHNVFLAIFSAFTFFGMLRALAHTWPGREHHLLGKYWPGLRAEHSLAGAADALCKMHGPRGFGQFVAFRSDSSLWKAQSKTVQLLETGFPDGSDVGRLWNEGLAFWGWWFYLSKFYEVFDTFIILAKGKRSSTLQTYHHTGAMMCMWAGIRYMSPPIWMFCFLNSGIHTMMYIYYTLSALSIRVPNRIKRTLTTMQITQFLIGITFAGLHLFVTYDIPITRAEAVSKTLDNIASSVSSAASVATSAGIAAWLKQAALRAAGEEGLAENVLAPPAQAALANARSAFQESHAYTPEEQSWTTGYETIPCIDTSGQSFAIWLNLLYLAPLTGLFVRFFVKSYTRRGRANPNQKKGHQAKMAIEDAAHGVDSKFEKAGRGVEDAVGGAAKEVNGAAKSSRGNSTPRSRKVSDTINKQWERFEKGSDSASESIKSGKDSLRKKASQGHDKLRRMFEDGSVSEHSKSPERGRGRVASTDSLRELAEDGVEKAGEEAEKLEEKAGKVIEDLKEQVGAESARGPSEESEPPQQKDSPKQDEMQESWADVGKDAYPKQAQQPTPAPSEEPEEKDTSSGANAEKTRSLSPQKASKLPRPASREPKSRSPEKKSSIPRPVGKDSSNNGTKPQSSTTTNNTSSSTNTSTSKNDSGTASKKGEDKAAASTPSVPQQATDSRPQSSSGADKIADENEGFSPVKSKKHKKKPKKLEKRDHDETSSVGSIGSSGLPLSPAAPNSSASAASAAAVETSSSSASKGAGTQDGKKSTNGDVEQGSAEASAEASSTKSGSGEVEVEDGEDSERLRFRHVDEGDSKGGEAEVKQGTSFADAAKEDGEGVGVGS